MNNKGPCTDHLLITRMQKPLSWREAVHAALDPLCKAGLASANYENQVINQIETLGPYCILRPGMALIHGPASADIKKTGLHILIDDQPVFFDGCSQPVTLLIGLCAPNKEQYLHLISQLAPLLRGSFNTAYFSRLSETELRTHFEPLCKKN